MICEVEVATAAGVVGLPGAAWAVTVKPVEPLMVLMAAVIVVVPIPALDARPPFKVIVALDVLLDVHDAELVTLAVVVSEYVPVATYCWVPP